jgi:hypothetical protein
MPERNASAGYISLGKETTKGTAVTPTVYTPYYSQSVVTDQRIMSDEPVYGSKYKRYQHLPGVRSHSGSIQVMAEPNTVAHWFNMLMTKGSTTGSNPYTHPFTVSGTTDPKSYTMDISFASQVVRFAGVEASKISIGWQDDKMVLDIDVSGLKSFYGREVASVSGSGPYTITLKTDTQFPRPTEGLVVGDFIQVWDESAVAYINAEIDSLTSTTIVVSENVAAVAAGDFVTLRPLTPSLTLLTPFLWAKTEYRFAADASTALSATQTRLEPGTELEIMHEFEDAGGAARSGDYDPASLPRMQYDVTFSLKTFLDDPVRFNEWNTLEKRAVVMRAFSGSTNQYELRITLNSIVALTDETPTESDSVIYHEVDYGVEYKTADGQAFDVKVIDALSSI